MVLEVRDGLAIIRLVAPLGMGAAVAFQAVATTFCLAFLARNVSAEQLGQFGLATTLLGLLVSLDGIRPVSLLTTVQERDARAALSRLASDAFAIAAVLGMLVVSAGVLIFGLDLVAAASAGVAGAMQLGLGPSLGKAEARHGASVPPLLTGSAWGIAMLVAVAAVIGGATTTLAATAFLAGPLLVALALDRLGCLVLPDMRARATWPISHGIHGTLTQLGACLTALLDRGVLFIFLGAATFGLYIVLSELYLRLSGACAMALGLFLRRQALMVVEGSPARLGGLPSCVLWLFTLVAAGCSLFAWPLLSLVIGTASDAQVLAFRILLVALTVSFAGQWSAVLLRSRGAFDLHWPPVIACVLGLVVGPFLVLAGGIVGAAATALVLRAGDVVQATRAWGDVRPGERLVLVSGPLLLVAVVLSSKWPL